MSGIAADAFLAVLAVIGAAFAVRGTAIRDAVVRFYNNPKITAHLQMKGYVPSMRIVGVGWFLFAGAILVANIIRQVSN